MPEIDRSMLVVGGSPAVLTILKSTVVTALALAAVRVAHRSRVALAACSARRCVWRTARVPDRLHPLGACSNPVPILVEAPLDTCSRAAFAPSAGGLDRDYAFNSPEGTAKDSGTAHARGTIQRSLASLKGNRAGHELLNLKGSRSDRIGTPIDPRVSGTQRRLEEWEDIMEHGNASIKNAPTERPQYSRGFELFVMIFCPLLNSMAGIVIDLYAPSMPSIGREFGVGAAVMQNTIVITTFGYAIGQLFFGMLSDWKGRRLSIIFGLSFFGLASVFAMRVHSLEALLLARALQGFSVGSCQVVSRAVLVDSVSGKRFQVAVIYLSVAFAIGLIAGPYVGGAIQQTYGWRANFAFYAAYAGVLLLASGVGLRETFPVAARSTPAQVIRVYKVILRNSAFSFSTLQLGLCFIGFTLWNQIGPDIVERLLGHSPRYFGATALTVGIAYLLGTVTSRLLVSVTSYGQRLWGSNIVFALGAITIALSGVNINLFLIVLGVMLCAFSQGIIFPGILSRALSFFPDRAGIAASLQGFGMLVVGSAGLALASLIQIHTSLSIASFFGALCVAAILALLLKPQSRKLA